MKTKYLEFYIWAIDADHALELAGHAADDEFKSIKDARDRYNPDFHGYRELYRVVVSRAEHEKDKTNVGPTTEARQ